MSNSWRKQGLNCKWNVREARGVHSMNKVLAERGRERQRESACVFEGSHKRVSDLLLKETVRLCHSLHVLLQSSTSVIWIASNIFDLNTKPSTDFSVLEPETIKPEPQPCTMKPLTENLNPDPKTLIPNTKI